MPRTEPLATRHSLLATVVLGLVLVACVSVRAPHAAAEHVAVLGQSHERLRGLIGDQGGQVAPSAWSERRQDICDGVYAVGVNLRVQEHPVGHLAGAWDQLRLAQRQLQLACGELALLSLSAAEPPELRLASPRRAAALAHLERACTALKAVAIELDPSDRGPTC